MTFHLAARNHELAREFRSIGEADMFTLLRSPLHEERLLALLLMVRAFATGPMNGAPPGVESPAP